MNVEELTLAASMAGVAVGAAVATYVRVKGGATAGQLATGAQAFADLRRELGELRDRIARMEGRTQGVDHE